MIHFNAVKTFAALEEILSRTRGLFEFFDKVEDRDESFEDALIEALRSLQLIINIGANYYKAYTDKTMHICCQVLEKCGLVHIELMASKTLKSLITTVEISSDKFCEILHHSEDIRYFIAIGAIAKQYPQVIKNQSDSLNTGFVYCETLFTKLLNFLECECQKNTKEIKNENIHIFLESFSDLMKHFRPSSEEYFKDLLRLFYKLCTEHQAEEVINGVVRVVISYMQFFSVFLYADYIRWHNIFRKNYKEKSNYFWINVLQTFYKYMSLHMSQEDKPNLKVSIIFIIHLD
ncbi:uncharacterized protein LOC106641476 [Copidosoma floridanum]|uniref:uncharacterized protein LOC106641476 n=1 Tax=Copidosoma floridanum TaxID=29053 RepID=UPI0006C9832E|nr:uncharacterized protein LOC106641476 [Copidosoma floridanum]